MRVAAFQAPLLPSGSMAALGRIGEQVSRCENAGASILCCPEAVLGGLADDAVSPHSLAIDPGSGELEALLAPLASERVTTIVGFTERGAGGRLHNTAAVWHRGRVVGLYRKLHPAIRRSVYTAGDDTPVFEVGGVTFGVILCRDSCFPEPARRMAAKGATVLFVPCNNGLPPSRATPELVAESRSVDIARARENAIWVVRADVAGRLAERVSYGSSAIVDPSGAVRASASRLQEELLMVDIPVAATGSAGIGPS